MEYKNISIIIPAYNEGRYLTALLDKIIAADSLGLVKEILIIDDCSKDSTKNILQKICTGRFSKKYSIKVMSKKVNEGKGAAVTDGLKIATGDIILIQDADLEYNPEDYPNMLDPIISGNTRVVYGSRTKGIKVYGNKYSSYVFFLGGKILSLLVNNLFNLKLTDQPTGYKLFTADLTPLLLKSIKESDFSFEIEMTAFFSQNNINIVEVPIHYQPRKISEGKKINFNDFIKAIYIAFKCKFQNGY